MFRFMMNYKTASLPQRHTALEKEVVTTLLQRWVSLEYTSMETILLVPAHTGQHCSVVVVCCRTGLAHLKHDIAAHITSPDDVQVQFWNIKVKFIVSFFVALGCMSFRIISLILKRVSLVGRQPSAFKTTWLASLHVVQAKLEHRAAIDLVF